MKIAIIAVGSLKKSLLRESAEEYLLRISRYLPNATPASVIEVPDATVSKKMPVRDVLKREGESITSKLKDGDLVVALWDKGKSFTSTEYSGFIEGALASGKKRLCFIVGGSYGLDDTVINSADTRLSLSDMTLPHELARVVLLEQTYRAFTIMKGEPYSH